jgi:NAD(P)-dependent dehydrogenase (short-subunit alcohol dehydrogenase family)
MELAGKTFVVTGAASGLGEGTARLFAAAGANVVVADLNAEAGERVADELGDSARFFATDVADEASVRAAVAGTLEAFGSIHGAVNCAGIGIAELVLRRDRVHPLEDFSRVLAVNLVGTFNVTRLASEAMAQLEPTETGERGVFVNTASVAAFEGQIGQAAYSASKGGVVAMTLPIARELARFGIRVCTIAPGTFETPMLMSLSEEARASLGEQVPFPSRLGRPGEFAALAKHIVENEMLNGETIRLDGAIRMGPR